MAEELERNWSPGAVKSKIIMMFRNNSSVVDDCALINMKRLFYLSLIAVPMRVLHIFLFADVPYAPRAWSEGVFLSHVVLLVFYLGVFAITLRLRKATRATATMRVLQYVIPIFIMASGVVIVTIDQLVTASITPLMIVSIAFGVVFLIRPLVSALVYLTTYGTYYFAIALTIGSPEVLLSNRVNGATILALGFLVSIIGWHYNYTNVTQRRCIERQQKQLEQIAYHDSLTGLYNRHYFDGVVEKELSSLQRYGHESVLIMLDIDNFKRINDTYGHLVGDSVLKQLARLIVDNVRKSDTVCRFGGEEFMILAPNTSLEEGFALAEKLRQLIAARAFVTGATTSHITASLGVSLLPATGRRRFEKYFSQADDALYRAKRTGKNRVEKGS